MKKINDFTIIKLLKKIKLRTLILLIILLVFNSYAWFIYSTKVASGLQAHVAAWDVSIRAGEGETANLQIVVDSIYPGMEKFEKTIEVNNTGEVKALLSYEVEGYTILGEKHEKTEETTAEDLKQSLLNDYPFKVSVEISSETIDAKDGYGTFTVTVQWPFESGDDNVDTYWGEKASEFSETNPEDSSMYIDLLLSVEQGGK